MPPRAASFRSSTTTWSAQSGSSRSNAAMIRASSRSCLSASPARLLGMRTVLVPPNPGVLSALGLLVSNLKAEFARTALQRAGAIDLALVARVFAELEAEAMAWFEAERVPEPARRIRRQASLRYQHQGFEL